MDGAVTSFLGAYPDLNAFIALFTRSKATVSSLSSSVDEVSADHHLISTAHRQLFRRRDRDYEGEGHQAYPSSLDAELLRSRRSIEFAVLSLLPL
jgi:hypothetical protein